jgi:hypothetical protein
MAIQKAVNRNSLIDSDDIFEHDSLDAFPTIGAAKRLYIAKDSTIKFWNLFMVVIKKRGIYYPFICFSIKLSFKGVKTQNLVIYYRHE